MKKQRRTLLRSLLGVLLIAVFVAGYAFLQVGIGSSPISKVLPFIASVGCFGVLLGAIFLFDAPTDFEGINRPFARITVSALAGLGLGLLWQWPAEGTALSVMVAAALGYFGMTWAKYVDF